MDSFDLLVVGVGGQGVVLASSALCDAALSSGYDVKKTDTLGMAQRGGSVVSHVRFGQKVFSPLISPGEADAIIALEKLEAARFNHFLKPGGLFIVNNLALPPLSVSLGQACYPDDSQITSILKNRSDRVYFVEGSAEAARLGNSRLLNAFMLGFAAAFLPLDTERLKEAILERLPERLRMSNAQAFERGRLAEPVSPATPPVS